MKRILFVLICALVFTAKSGGEIRKHALLIGINGYGLSYADKDATDFGRFLSSPDGGSFPSANILTLTNAQANRTAIITAISKLSRDIESDGVNYPADQRLVYVFVSGHSKVDDATDEAYFMPWGSDPNLPATGIRSDDFLAMVKNEIRAEHIVYFFDTCHAASSLNQGSSSKDFTKGFQNKLDLAWTQAFSTSKSRHLGIFSSAASQRSYEDAELQHGIFTYYLLKGLGGEADQPPYGDKNGIVSSVELRKYVETFVPQRAEKFGAQTPQASLVWDDIPLATVSTTKKLGIYFDGVPDVLIEKIRTFVANGDKILSVSLAADDSWAVVSTRSWSSTSPGFRDTIDAYKKVDQSTLNLAVLGSSGCHVLVFGNHGNAYKNSCPAAITKAIQDKSEADVVIQNVAANSNNEFVLVYNRNGSVRSSSLPKELIDRLEGVNHDHQSIDYVAITDDRSWAVVYDAGSTFGYSAQGMKKSFTETLQLLYERDAGIQALAVQPSTKGWVIVAPE